MSITMEAEREMRRQAALADVAVLEELGPADNLDELVAWAVRNTSLDDE